MKDLHPLFQSQNQDYACFLRLYLMCVAHRTHGRVLPACRQDCMMPTDTGKRMLSLQALLNPASPGHFATSFRQSDLVLTTSSALLRTKVLQTTDVSPSPKDKSMESVSMTRSKPQGSINFAPFEEIDQLSYQEICRFCVSPFGKIWQTCQRIPYNSSKKDFFEKTGRESIEGKRAAPRRWKISCTWKETEVKLAQFSNTNSVYQERKSTIPSCGITTSVLFI